MHDTAEIIVVSGLPRSGTSLMMQMLAAGGVSPVTDGARQADDDNPRGYFEFEPIKKIKQDSAWLPAARGKAVKAVSQLLFDLPATERYRVVFLERDLDEVLSSQEKMLARIGRPATPRKSMREAFRIHLKRLEDWLNRQANIETMRIRYGDIIAAPVQESQRVSDFLGGRVDATAMAAAVDPGLYRNRESKSLGPSGPKASNP